MGFQNKRMHIVYVSFHTVQYINVYMGNFNFRLILRAAAEA